MSKYYRLHIITFVLPLLLIAHCPLLIAQEIIAGKNATQIGGIFKDTIKVIAGSTYSYTVDTPEGEGLISTKPGVKDLLPQITSKDGSKQRYQITTQSGEEKNTGDVVNGDRLVVTSQNGKASAVYIIAVHAMALSGKLQLEHEEITVNTTRNLTLHFTAGQRSPDATVRIYMPMGITVTPDNITVNVIGRGEVKLKDLGKQSIGRVGTLYSYSKVGEATITKSADGGSVVSLSHLDLRPANGPDLVMVIEGVVLANVGKYSFKASYTTSKPEVLSSPGIGSETATLSAIKTITDFERVLDKGLQYKETSDSYRQATFKWSADEKSTVYLMQSLDDGRTWTTSSGKVDVNKYTASVSGLEPNKLYTFRLSVKDGRNKGFSNLSYFYSGKMDIKNFGVTGEDNQDNTEKINEAIAYLNSLGGGTLFFSTGIYSVRTVHLKNNVYLFIDKDATIKALKGGDTPETAWFSDKKYRSGLSPTDIGPYEDPENYLTKQDVGHTFFRNSMFFGERLDNVKIIGNGLITGNGNLVTGDKVMNNPPDNRADKMFAFKLCTNVEIGGLYSEEDLWYDAEKDEPYYIEKDGSKNFTVDNMLNIDRAGHFVLLATGTDNIHVHNTYFGKQNTSNSRDIYDFMSCNNVTVTNIYCKVSSDDIVKPGSDCSLGFTRPAQGYKVRNIIGDTNCNLFQIGSETADDIIDVHVDNIYVLGANKAGFSISTNDGGHIKNIHLNCGHTGVVHSRSKMYRTFAPFFISISNRGRILGTDVGTYKFSDNGRERNELLVKNVNIGQVENIILNGIDIYEVYAGSSFRGDRWKPYDGSQRRATSIIAGYSLPENDKVQGGLNFKLPNGKHTGYIKNVVFNDVHVLVKGGNPLSDTTQAPPELGVGQYNVSNLKIQPSYGIWARHVSGLKLKDCSFNYENPDGRYALFLEDVLEAFISSLKMVRAKNNDYVIRLKNSPGAIIQNSIYYHDEWGRSGKELEHKAHSNALEESLPKKGP
ncbi:MAG TPA: hypothetical protein VJ184_02500 [Chryseolinea sp.]|nr:hypothetical protein [Chryseolinea sp.]